MNVKVNGEAIQAPDGALTITDVLKISKVEMPDMVSVQLNGEFVDRNAYSTTIVRNNNEVEFLFFIGGGQ